MKKFLFAIVLWSLSISAAFAATAADYRAAAEKGDAEAQFNLALCYKNGWGVSKNMAEAVKWYQKAAEKEYAPAQFNLALCYKNGWGVSKNMAEAVKWYQKAARHGIPNAKKALNDLGETW